MNNDQHWNKKSALGEQLLADIAHIDVIDTHDHSMTGLQGSEYRVTDPIVFLINQYVEADILSSAVLDAQQYKDLLDSHQSLEARWPLFYEVWKRIAFTAYARVISLVLEDVCAVRTPSLDALKQLQAHLLARNPASSIESLKEVGIRHTITDSLFPPNPQRPLRYYENQPLADFLEKPPAIDSHFKPALNLQFLHELRHYGFIEFIQTVSGHPIRTLKEYENAVYELLKRSVERGVVCLKDQSGYRRTIQYNLQPFHAAEALFVKLVSDPRNQLAWPEAKPLDDYLFHTFMIFAQELKLPVQIHTGHLASVRNRVSNANAEKFTSVLEHHRWTNFDLFHGNWPYMSDLLFLGKNYPNVHINLCWVHIIDPDYSIELVKRAVKTIPSNKIHAFGGDFWDSPEFTRAHLTLAKKNMATALSSVISDGWLNYDEALQYLKASFFYNPRDFYHLGQP